MLDWQELVRLPDAELARLDVAAVNLACAAGLPGADRIDWERCLRTLDDWARRCGRFTAGVLPHFRRGHCDYPGSEPKFRIQAMITHLQRDLGARYHPGRIADDAVFRPEDSFVHGVVQGEGGTCGSLPIVYTAVSRRLGYPVMLADTRGHLYCRWDAPPQGECFNIEASGEGVSFFPDEHYRTGRYALTDEEAAGCGYLQSLSPRDELALFQSQRGFCWLQERDFGQAATAFAWANELAPRRQHAWMAGKALNEWRAAVQARLPSRLFPKLDLGLPAPQFFQLPRAAEREMIALRVIEGFLNDPDLERRWWGPMRRDPWGRPPGLPEVLKVDYRWDRPAREAALNL